MSLLLTSLLMATANAAAAQGGPDGAALFAQHCATCHQVDGSGTVGLAPPLKGAHWSKLGADRGYLPAVLLHGLSGPIKVNGQSFVGSMPAFGGQLDDASLAAIANHLQRLQGSDESALSADEFKAQRQRAGSPPQTRQRRDQVLGH
ncbi:MAG TPA: cytochrome c [Ideonella sp.]|nr:cytochrome c [Ideonella sp.]